MLAKTEKSNRVQDASLDHAVTDLGSTANDRSQAYAML